MSHRGYPTDLTGTQWAILEPLVPPPQPGGRPPAHARRAMPHDLPPWQTVYHDFWLWRLNGTWEHINAALREQVRRQAGRDPTPSAAIIASQSVKTTENWIQGGAG